MTDEIVIKFGDIHKQTFMYGTKLSRIDDAVLIENHLIPPGAVVQEWHMTSTFFYDRSLPMLPILKRGHDYEFTFHYEAQPQGSVYFEIIYYRKNGAELTKEICKHVCTITFPLDAYSYSIKLYNASMSTLKFSHMTLKRKDKISE